jgi:hypothetical protein
MASAPVPNMPPRRRSFAGPVILIILGVIFLLVTTHAIPWIGLWVWFAHYWPLLLILWGAIKLVEFILARRQGYQPAGIGFGGGFLIFLIIVCGLTATGLSKVDWLGMQQELGINGPWLSIFGNKYEYSNQIDQPIASHGTFRLALQRGSITVLPSSDEKVHVSVHKTVIASSKEEADRIDQATQPQIKSDEIPSLPVIPDVPGLSPAERARIQSEIDRSRAEVERAKSEVARAKAEAERARQEIVSVNIAQPSNSFAETNIEVHVPPALPLELSTQHGNIEVRSRQADVKLTAFHGDVTVDDLTGNATVAMHGGLHGGDLNVRNVQGNVTVEGHANETNISNVSGLVAMSGDYMGETNVQNLGQGFRFNSSRTDLETGKIQGEMRMDSGDLRMSNVSGLKVSTHSKDIHLEAVTGDIEVNNRDGSVDLRAGKAQAGNIVISNRDGGIEVALPVQGAFQVEANTRGGEIHSDFGEIKIDKSSEQNPVASGTIGAGGRKIQLSTEHADIDIRKGDQISENKDKK